MEEIIKTPRKKNGEGDENALIRELNEALQREMDKSPDDIDTKKVDAIIDLLESVNPIPETLVNMSATDFAHKYLETQGISINKRDNSNKYHNTMSKLRWVACLAVIFAMVIGGNYISVKATNKGIFTNIKECAYILYFDVFGTSTSEKEDVTLTDIEEITIDMSSQKVESWNDAQALTETEFAVPHYIPDELSDKEIFVQIDKDDNIGVSCQYYNDTNSVRLMIRSLGGIGVWSSVREEREGLIEQVRWGDYDVYLYQVDDAMQAIFQDAMCIYTVETNCDQETLKKIVLEMR